MPFTARARANGAPTSQTSFPNGSQLNPSLTFQGAANSGVYHAGSGNVAVSVNGTQKMVVHSNGLSVAGNITGNLDATYLTGTIDTARLPANITVSQVTATTFVGNGSQLSGIITNNASLLTEGILNTALLPSTIGNTNTTFIGNGSQLTGLGTPMSISNVQITDSSYTLIDDTAVPLEGGYCIINGNGFAPGSLVSIGTDLALATSYVSVNRLKAQVPAKTSGSYTLTIIRGDTTTASLPLGVTYSVAPVWSTSTNLGGVVRYTPFTKTLAAPSDSAVVYANTTSLPPETALASNGIFSGNIASVADDTSYTFTVRATDAEFQDITRTFQLSYSKEVTGIFGAGLLTGEWDTSSYTSNTSDTITWTVPTNIYSISAVCIGGGGGGYAYEDNAGGFRSFAGGGNGGDLRFIRNLAVTPGENLTIVKGGKGKTNRSGMLNSAGFTTSGGLSSISRGGTVLIVAAGGGIERGAQNGTSSTISGSIGGGNGGLSGYTTYGTVGGYRAGTGGGGTGGWYGNGGDGGSNNSSGFTYSAQPAATNSYGGGGGGSTNGLGGGTGAYGATANPNGAAGSNNGSPSYDGGQGGAGPVAYGSGGKSGTYNGTGDIYESGMGHVRIVW